MTPTLRPYQSESLEHLRSLSKTKRRLLLTQPTGGGKTVLASAIIHSARKKSDAKILFFAHRLELVDQAVSQLAKWGVTEVGVMRADDARTDSSMPVQVATVQTLARRNLPPSDIVFVDEAHRAASDSYRKILEAYPEAIVIGLTATPCRLDGKPLGDVFEELIVSATYTDLIADGFIREPRVYAAEVMPDLSGVHTRAGDYAEDELEKAVLDPHVVGNIVDGWLKHAEGKKTVLFAVGIEHSKTLVDLFRSRGIDAHHLDGTTPEKERRRTLAALEGGQIRLVSNVGVLTEGWDQPSVKCAILARPTKSLSLFMQMAGRILRPFNDEMPLLLDHGGNVDRHGMPCQDRTWSLTERAATKEKSTHHICKGCFAYVRKNPCELCGYAAPVQHREIRQEAGVLVERTQGDDRRSFFDTQLQRAKANGFKPGFAGAKFKEKFGSWPPWTWSQEAKNAFSADSAWKHKQMQRERERNFWQEKIHVPEREELSESELADWLRRMGADR